MEFKEDHPFSDIKRQIKTALLSTDNENQKHN